MKNLMLLFFFFLFSFPMLHAQEEPKTRHYGYLRYTIDGYLSVAVPMDQLRENMAPGAGFGITTLFGKGGLPVLAGLDYRFHGHNIASSNIYIYNGVFDELHNMSTKNYTHQGDLMIRVMPEINFPVTPYIDVFFGFNRFAIWTSIQGDEEFEDDRGLDSYNTRYKEAGDWAKAYGAGFGFKINLFSHNIPIALNIRAAYRKGGIANYYVKKDHFEIIDSTIEAFEKKESPTDFLMIQLGIIISGY